MRIMRKNLTYIAAAAFLAGCASPNISSQDIELRDGFYQAGDYRFTQDAYEALRPSFDRMLAGMKQDKMLSRATLADVAASYAVAIDKDGNHIITLDEAKR